MTVDNSGSRFVLLDTWFKKPDVFHCAENNSSKCGRAFENEIAASADLTCYEYVLW